METRVPFSRPLVAPEAARAVEQVLASGWLTTGPECAAFEQEFAAVVLAENAVAVSSCTAAVELALRAMRLSPRARVLLPTMTFCGVAEAIAHAGHVPVLVDSDPGTGQVTPDTCRAAASDCRGPDAMVVLHYAGFPAPVAELADAAGLPLSRVVEDAAHALGTVVGARPVGSISGATCFSFYATKNLPIGEGGMLTTDDPELAAWARRARLHGMSDDAWRRYLPGGSWRYTVTEAGLKANLSDVQAAIGRVQLKHLAGWQARRSEIAARYRAALTGLPGLEVAPTPTPRQGVHAWHLYPVRVHEQFGMTRDALVASLAERGIGTSVHFIPVHRLPHFRDVARRPYGGLPGADTVFEQLVSLPLYPALTDEQVDAVCDAVHAASSAGARPRTTQREVVR